MLDWKNQRATQPSLAVAGEEFGIILWAAARRKRCAEFTSLRSPPSIVLPDEQALTYHEGASPVGRQRETPVQRPARRRNRASTGQGERRKRLMPPDPPRGHAETREAFRADGVGATGGRNRSRPRANERGPEPKSRRRRLPWRGKGRARWVLAGEAAVVGERHGMVAGGREVGGGGGARRPWRGRRVVAVTRKRWWRWSAAVAVAAVRCSFDGREGDQTVQ